MSENDFDKFVGEVLRLRKDVALVPSLIETGKKLLAATTPDFPAAIESFRAAVQIAPNHLEANALLKAVLDEVALIERLWVEHRSLTDRVAASRGFDLAGKKAVLQAMGLWPE